MLSLSLVQTFSCLSLQQPRNHPRNHTLAPKVSFIEILLKNLPALPRRGIKRKRLKMRLQLRLNPSRLCPIADHHRPQHLLTLQERASLISSGGIGRPTREVQWRCPVYPPITWTRKGTPLLSGVVSFLLCRIMLTTNKLFFVWYHLLPYVI
jgi:hypothetical protein